ncbi:hypothetical protein GCM10022393_32260 [Aquimarina addita]|uniref:Secretion system C-terminal sorting domain-containing protein n=1 Tax=Aquimarina addita TaxID=870485 RepID=A0ABP6URR9_9FLAO
MRKIILITFIFLLGNNFADAQINFTGCENAITPGSTTLFQTGTTNDGGIIRNIYTSSPAGCTFGNCGYRIIWNDATSNWEVLLSNDNGATYQVFLYTNSSASSPNPPSLSLGSWVKTLSACNNTITALSGDVQSTLHLPTASSFIVMNTLFQGLTYTFSTTDFGYSDGDGDVLNNIRITDIPATGTLYVDANDNDTFDTGEELLDGTVVSKMNLDAGNLQYITSVSTNSSFNFEVNDGFDYSDTAYTATLNVTPIPTVILSIADSSNLESILSNNTITATLSNAYGEDTTIDLSFGGTALNISDYTSSASSIIISAGSLSNNSNLKNTPDTLDEVDETVIIDIIGVINGFENGTQQLTYTIIDDDTTPTTTGLADQNLIEDFTNYTIDLNNLFDDAETDDDDLIYTVSGNTNIGISIDANGIATISSTLNFNGTETITFTAEDEGGLTVDTSADFIVAADNDPPTTSGLGDQNLIEDFTNYTIDLTNLFDDAETDDDDLIYSVSGNTNIGISIDANGIATISSIPNFSGTETITFTAEDEGGLTIGTTANFIVAEEDDIPIITGDTEGSVTEDEAPMLISTGDLDAVGGDAGEDEFIPETLTGIYGTLSITINGDWEYNAVNSQNAIQELNTGDTIIDSFTTTNADNVTTETVVITIHGVDDQALSVDDLDTELSSIHIFPNPTSGILNINTTVKKVILHNYLGKKVMETHRNTFNVASLASGIYFVSIETEKGIGIQKLIKN